MTSDFPRAAARVSEGTCPLCGETMGLNPGHHFRRRCDECGVGWSLTTLEDSGRVVIQTDRRLTKPEIRALYARPEEES